MTEGSGRCSRRCSRQIVRCAMQRAIFILTKHQTEHNGVGRADANAFAAARAYFLVNPGQRSVHRDGIIRTNVEAALAADTANLAVFTGQGTRPFVLAGYCIGIEVLGDDFNQRFRAGSHAKPAGFASRAVNMGDPVGQVDRAIGTGIDTITKSHAAISA